MCLCVFCVCVLCCVSLCVLCMCCVCVLCLFVCVVYVCCVSLCVLCMCVVSLCVCVLCVSCMCVVFLCVCRACVLCLFVNMYVPCCSMFLRGGLRTFRVGSALRSVETKQPSLNVCLNDLPKRPFCDQIRSESPEIVTNSKNFVNVLRYLLKNPDVKMSLEFWQIVLQRSASLSPSMAVSVFVLMASIPRIEGVSEEMFLALKTACISCNEDLCVAEKVQLILALSRVGMLGSDCRSILYHQRLDRADSQNLTLLGLALYTNSNTTLEIGDKFQWLESALIRIAKTHTDIYLVVNAVYALCSRGNDSEPLLSNLYKSRILGRSVSKLPFATKLQLVEMHALLPSSKIAPICESTHSEEIALAHQSLKIHPEWPFPCLSVLDKTVIDIDSLANPLSRVLRSKIAEKLALTYRVLRTENEQLGDRDTVFLQPEDPPRKPENNKTPYFAYSRKIDLK